MVGRRWSGLSAFLATMVLFAAGGAPAAEKVMTSPNELRDEETRGTGPFPAIMEMDAGLPGHVVYRPEDLEKVSKLAVLVWGNGGCSDDGASARKHLGEIASHGYLVIAPGRILSGPQAVGKAVPRQPGPDGILPPPATSSSDVRAGIDWALAENGRAGSRYQDRIDTQAVAIGGHSCGGLQAIELAGDPRVRTVMIHNSGVYNDGVQRISGLTVHKDMLRNFRTPIVYILGGPQDSAYPNGMDDARRIDHVPLALLNLPVGHGGTFDEPNGGAVAQVSVDWLEWQLRGDKSAARTFLGPNCRLCTGSQWTIERKGM